MYVKLNLTVIMKSGYILEVSAITGRELEWGNGTFSAGFHPPWKDFKNAVKKQNAKKRFLMMSILECKYSVCIHVLLRGRFICS